MRPSTISHVASRLSSSLHLSSSQHLSSRSSQQQQCSTDPAFLVHDFMLSPGCQAVELSRLRRGAVEALSRYCRGAVEALPVEPVEFLSSSCREPVEPVEPDSMRLGVEVCRGLSRSVEVCRGLSRSVEVCRGLSRSVEVCQAVEQC